MELYSTNCIIIIFLSGKGDGWAGIRLHVITLQVIKVVFIHVYASVTQPSEAVVTFLPVSICKSGSLLRVLIQRSFTVPKRWCFP